MKISKKLLLALSLTTIHAHSDPFQRLLQRDEIQGIEDYVAIRGFSDELWSRELQEDGLLLGYFSTRTDESTTNALDFGLPGVPDVPKSCSKCFFRHPKPGSTPKFCESCEKQFCWKCQRAKGNEELPICERCFVPCEPTKPTNLPEQHDRKILYVFECPDCSRMFRTNNYALDHYPRCSARKPADKPTADVVPVVCRSDGKLMKCPYGESWHTTLSNLNMHVLSKHPLKGHTH